LGMLFVVSFLLFPQWLGEFLRVALRYPSYKNVQTGPGYLLSGCCGEIWPWLVVVAGAACLMAAWWFALREGGRHVDAAFALTMVMTCFLLPQTSIVNQLALLPAIVFLMRHLSSWLARFAVAVLSIIGSWVAFSAWYNTNYALNMSLPPLVVLCGLALWYTVGTKFTGESGQAEAR